MVAKVLYRSDEGLGIGGFGPPVLHLHRGHPRSCRPRDLAVSPGAGEDYVATKKPLRADVGPAEGHFRA